MTGKKILEGAITALSLDRAELIRQAEKFKEMDHHNGYIDTMLIIEGYDRCLKYLSDVYCVTDEKEEEKEEEK